MFQNLLAFCFLQSWLWLTLGTISTTTAIAKQGCPTRCGNLVVPYPFGIGIDSACSINDKYNIRCDTSFEPPKPFFGQQGNAEILGISDTQIRIKGPIASKCYGTELGQRIDGSDLVWISLENTPFVFSHTSNKFFLIGCDDIAFIRDVGTGKNFSSGCVTMCQEPQMVYRYNGTCSGIGCCQTSIPKGMTVLRTIILPLRNHSGVLDFNPCGHAFLADQNKFTFNVQDLSDPNFTNKASEKVSVVLEWFVGVDETCHQAQQNRSSYACRQNTNCTDVDLDLRGGYRCSCLPGYEGNPYLTPGCTDINECLLGSGNPCSKSCTNIPGGFRCSCPYGYRGDGLKKGTGCTIHLTQFLSVLISGVGFGILLLLVIIGWSYFTIRKRYLQRMREKFFVRNGGQLLMQQLFPNGGTVEQSKIFSAEELRAATKNYSENRVLGKGGYGTVYKGILKDGREVAIKKSKLADQTESQIQEFINEVVILTQINHRNVVKLLGCCLETEVPLLVYEFISNGTLSHHIHRKGGTSWLNWENSIRVATEAANALAYLHSEVSIPIIHRDVKSANILLDANYAAKVADFGASRLAPIDQNQATTLVQGTFGYLDPESLQTGQLTDKSDVYSFGVVLAELLTKEKAVSSERKSEEVNLAMYFVSSIQKDRLFEILDPRLVIEASEEQLVTVAELVMKCINMGGEDRPTMKEVALELEGLKKQANYTSLIDEQQDLYPVPSQVNLRSNPELSEHCTVPMDISSEMIRPR